MSDVIARFEFDAKSNLKGFEKAKERLKYEEGNSGWDTDSDAWGLINASNYYIEIYSTVKDAGKAGNICRAHGGKPC